MICASVATGFGPDSGVMVVRFRAGWSGSLELNEIFSQDTAFFLDGQGNRGGQAKGQEGAPFRPE
jgi:hypothetical protein